MSNRLEYAPLGELLENTQYGMSIPSSTTGSIPMFKMNNFDNGYMSARDVDLVSISPTDFEQFKLNHGDILFNRTNSLELVGKSGIFTLSGDYVFASYLVRLIVDKSKIDPFFLNHYLNNEATKSELKRLATKGVSQANINPTQLKKKLLVPIFSLAEQTKIAQILSTWDKAIATTERLLANSRQQKNALAQQLLTGQKRFKQFSDSWKNYRLGELFERVTKKNTENNSTVVTISAQHGLIRQDEFFKKTVASETLEGYYLLSQGQFAYNKSYSNGYPMGAIKRLNRYEKGVVTTLYICFAVSDHANCCPVFFEQFFDAGLLNEGLAQIAHEGGRAHGLLNVKPSDFFSLKVKVPPLAEQQKIAQVLSTADAEITNLQAQLAKLKLEKKALMQQLLTGQRRVRLDDDLEQVQTRRVG